MKAKFLIICAVIASPLLMAETAPSGCAQKIAGGVTQFAVDINAINAALQDPAAQQAIATLRAGSTMLAWAIAGATGATSRAASRQEGSTRMRGTAVGRIRCGVMKCILCCGRRCRKCRARRVPLT